MKKFCIYGNFSIASIAFLPSLGHGLGQVKITPRPAERMPSFNTF